MATQPKLCYPFLRFRSVKCLIHYRDSIHYRDICRVTIVMVKIVISLSTKKGMAPVLFMRASCNNLELESEMGWNRMAKLLNSLRLVCVMLLVCLLYFN